MFVHRTSCIQPSTLTPHSVQLANLKVNVTYTGAKKQTVVPTNCAVKAGSLDANGAGTIAYDCSWDNAANATGAILSFSAAGLIAGENHTIAADAISTPVVATLPIVEITKVPTQTSLLKAVDSVSPVNFTVRGC